METKKGINFSIDQIFDDENQFKVIIEAAHIYVDEEPSEEHYKAAKIGASYANLLSSLGCKVEKMLFVDDYNPIQDGNENSLDLEAYVNSLSDVGYTPDKVVFESEMVSKSQEIVAKLKGNEAVYDENGVVYLAKGGIELVNGKYSCALLDSALSLQKVEQSDLALNILPYSFRKQQKKMDKILSSIDVDESKIFPIYFDSNKDDYFPKINNIRTENLSDNAKDKVKGILSLMGSIGQYQNLSLNYNLSKD